MQKGLGKGCTLVYLTTMTATNHVTVSETGRINGRGSDPYKWVSWLTPQEREIVRSGGIVLVPDYCTAPQCSGYKRVYLCSGGKFRHRNATPEEISAI